MLVITDEFEELEMDEFDSFLKVFATNSAAVWLNPALFSSNDRNALFK